MSVLFVYATYSKPWFCTLQLEKSLTLTNTNHGNNECKKFINSHLASSDFNNIHLLIVSSGQTADLKYHTYYQLSMWCSSQACTCLKDHSELSAGGRDLYRGNASIVHQNHLDAILGRWTQWWCNVYTMCYNTGEIGTVMMQCVYYVL